MTQQQMSVHPTFTNQGIISTCLEVVISVTNKEVPEKIKPLGIYFIMKHIIYMWGLERWPSG